MKISKTHFYEIHELNQIIQGLVRNRKERRIFN